MGDSEQTGEQVVYKLLENTLWGNKGWGFDIKLMCIIVQCKL